MDEQHYIDSCLERIEEKVQWGPRNTWTTYNFNKLSFYLKESSGISLSSRTLRRLINSNRTYKPQAATKNALAIYLGFRDWEDLKRAEASDNVDNESTVRHNRLVPGPIFLSRLTGSIWFYLILLVTAIIVSSFLFYADIVLKLNKSRVEFSSNYTPGPAPQRVSFYYDVSKVNSTNIFINKNFYDDGDIIPINKNRHFFTSEFTLPDHYSVKIIANGERISCIRIHVLTDGWEGILNDIHLGKIPDNSPDGVLSVPRHVIVDFSDIGGDDFQLEYRNIREFNASGDAITLETEIRHTSGDARNCLETTIQLINLHGRIGFTFVKPDCDPSLLKAEFGDVLLNGEFHDLEAFYQEMNEWRKVKMKTEKKHIYVYLDDQLIYSIKYKDPLDEMKGIAFKFHGPGEVNYVKLYDGDQLLIYEENF